MFRCILDYDVCEVVTRWTVAFCVTTKDTLRGTADAIDTEELRQVLSAENMNLLKDVKMKPLRCIIIMKTCIKHAYENGLMLKQAQWMVS